MTPGEALLLFRKKHYPNRVIARPEFAEILGVSVQQVEKYEKSASRVTVDVIQKLCNHYKVSPSTFFDTTNLPGEIVRYADMTEHLQDKNLRNAIRLIISITRDLESRASSQ